MLNKTDKSIAAEKGNNRHTLKVCAIIVAALIILGIGVFYLYFNVLKPSMDFKRATELMETGDYDEAISIFKSLGDYKDSPAQMIEAQYRIASELMENENYDKAINSFKALGDYKDSATQLMEAQYNSALLLFKQENYDEAIIRFNDCSSYSDALRYIQLSKMNIIVRDKKYNDLADTETTEFTPEDLSMYYDLCLSVAKQCENSNNLEASLKLYAKCTSKKEYSDELKNFLKRADFLALVNSYSYGDEKVLAEDNNVLNDSVIRLANKDFFTFKYKYGDEKNVSIVIEQNAVQSYRFEITYIDWADNGLDYNYYKVGDIGIGSGNKAITYSLPLSDIAKHQNVCIDAFGTESDSNLFGVQIDCEDICNTYALINEYMNAAS